MVTQKPAPMHFTVALTNTTATRCYANDLTSTNKSSWTASPNKQPQTDPGMCLGVRWGDPLSKTSFFSFELRRAEGTPKEKLRTRTVSWSGDARWHRSIQLPTNPEDRRIPATCPGMGSLGLSGQLLDLPETKRWVPTRSRTWIPFWGFEISMRSFN